MRSGSPIRNPCPCLAGEGLCRAVSCLIPEYELTVRSLLVEEGVGGLPEAGRLPTDTQKADKAPCNSLHWPWDSVAGRAGNVAWPAEFLTSCSLN